jgi:hypothetical protein
VLFNYRYVNNSIERFQVYLDHLVKEVWCKAAGEFSLDLLHPDLQVIVLEIYNTEEDTTRGKIGDWLYGPIRTIFDLFKNLDPAQRQRVSSWYDYNNDIEALCACDPDKLPATYSDISAIDANLKTALEAFCKSLFTNVIHLKAVAARIGEIGAHYTAFVAENKKGKCPYCGYGDIKGQYHSYREAYDHYLPKDIYPFNSVNFRNLAPMCHECNSTYKLRKDPIRQISEDGIRRRKAFYSYAEVEPSITVSVTLNAQDVANLLPRNVNLELASPGYEEEVETWRDVFGIEERYKAKFCGESDGIAWLQQMVEERENVGLTRDQLLNMTLQNADRYPFTDTNFLKKPFLVACQTAKLI